ncbi:hypothetical protein [Streptomyces brevispora]|uniref:Uncharacterized protein n=1 Tax=Streptomyces brevispora TaxID=887462 RepID=A0ABZ1GDW8_9ACTN|nr:hypothetical protein [Streptomyces brevispora]WSC18144.1 hypothetical protein OIE64_21685 [Streptomyces brevispora]
MRSRYFDLARSFRSRRYVHLALTSSQPPALPITTTIATPIAITTPIATRTRGVPDDRPGQRGPAEPFTAVTTVTVVTALTAVGTVRAVTTVGSAAARRAA